MISLDAVTKVYEKGSESVQVLDGLSLEIAEGGFYALMGPSGSGKTTMLNLVGGLDHADGGRVVVDGADLDSMDSNALASWRADTIGFVFQGFNLLPVLSAQENIELPLLLTPLGKAKRREQALHALDLVGLADRASHKPAQLSGGQEQRVAIARALAMDPKIILADEPTGDLDRESADAVLDLLVRLNEDFNKTILMVTHDPLAAERARNTAHLDKGRLGRVDDNRARAPA